MVLVVDDEDTDAELEEFFGIVSKLSVLEAEKSRAELERSDEYQRLQDQADALGNDLCDSVDEFAELLETYRDIERNT